MLVRWAGPILISLLWASSMTWLVWNDFWPAWTAQDAPKVGISHVNLLGGDPVQTGIYDQSGRRVGAAWTRYSGSMEAFTRTDEFRLDYMPVVGSVLVICDTDYEADGLLRAFRVNAYLPDNDFPINVEGERFHKRVAVAIRAGNYYQGLDLDGDSTAMITEMFQPFSRLPHLEVGQTWRMQVLDPWKLIMHDSDPFVTSLVKVTGKAAVSRPEGLVECFVVEANEVTAWVAADGAVLEQQVRLPIPTFGLLTLKDEPFDTDLRDYALQLLPVRKVMANEAGERGKPLSESAIDLAGISKRFGATLAVRELSLRIAPGELFAFLGPNGAGKTTTIKMIAGLMKPDQGEVRVCGHAMGQNGLAAKSQMAYVPDLPFLYEKLTGREFLNFVAEMYGMSRAQRDRALLPLVNRLQLESFLDHLTESYSHGMKQRVVLGAALLHEPRVLVIDEPMVGLDPRTVRVVKDLFIELTQRGGTVFMSTHTLEVAEAVAHRIGIIHKGKLIAVGTMKELQQQATRQHSLEEIFLELTEGAEGDEHP